MIRVGQLVIQLAILPLMPRRQPLIRLEVQPLLTTRVIQQQQHF